MTAPVPEQAPHTVMYASVKPYATYTAEELLEVYRFLADLNDADLLHHGGIMTAPVPEQAVTAEAVRQAMRAWMHAVACDDTGHHCHELPGQDYGDDLAMRAALEAAAPAIREAERHRLFGSSPDREQYHGLIKLTRADAAIAERDRWRAVLADHYLAGIECDPERKLDNPVCGCSRVFLGWHPSIGEARQAWIDHVAGLIGDPVCPDCNYPLHRCAKCRDLIGHDGYDDHQCRVAGLERLAADMLSRYVSAVRLGGPVAFGDALVAKWETILKGQS